MTVSYGGNPVATTSTGLSLGRSRWNVARMIRRPSRQLQTDPPSYKISAIHGTGAAEYSVETDRTPSYPVPRAMDVLHTIGSALVVYVVVVVLVRIAGKRATSQLTNFDWIVTVAIGSIAGSTIIQKDLGLFNGLSAIFALLAVQWIVTAVSARWKPFSQLVSPRPTIVLYRGEFQRDAMRSERLTEQEVISAVRASGFARIEEVGAVILEADGKFSVVTTEGNIQGVEARAIERF